MKRADFSKLYFGTIKWDEMFDSEQELIEYLKKIEITKYKNTYKGYEFIEGFQKTLNQDKELSKSQLTQLKRLAKEIYKYHHKL